MDKRFLLFIWLASLVFLIWSLLQPRPQRPDVPQDQPKQVAEQPADDKKPAPALVEDKKPRAPEKEAEPVNAVATVNDINLGDGGDEYYLQATLTNEGAAVTDLFLNPYRNEARDGRFHLLQEESAGRASYLLTVNDDPTLSTKTWEIESSGSGHVTFRTMAHEGNVEVRKRFLIEPGEKMAKLVLEFTNKSEEPIKEFHYRLEGGTGVPIEGDWYTNYFRRAAFMLKPTNGGYPYVQEELASAITSNHDNKQPQLSFTTTPVQYAGVSGQYFTALIIQPGDVLDPEMNLIAEAKPVFLSRNARPDTSEIGIDLRSQTFAIAPGETVKHEFLLYHGPKERETLEEFPAEYHLTEVIHYPEFLYIDLSFISRGLVWVLKVLYNVVGDYGLAIILLTVIVRLCLYPLTYRQNRSMMKVQAIQPLVEQIKKECADDREQLNRRMMDLYAKHKVNPLGGCLPIFLQLPIFVGLWQGLQNSYALRQAPFLFGWTWIKDLSAPDQLFRWPFDVPIVESWLGPYFNLLPILAMIQIIVQMKYMSPPPTTDEARLQQRIMMVMMAFMGFLFYKVPSGLCIYIITSGLWGMLERKFMPKPKPVDMPAPQAVSASSNGADWKKPVDPKKKKTLRK